jgi:hypothetical protein
VDFAAAESVTLIRTAATSTDAYGNDVRTNTTSEVAGCAIWPRMVGNSVFTSESVQGRDQVITGLTVLMPPGTVVLPTDLVVVRGIEYDVDGDPGLWSSTLTGLQTGTEVALKRVTG